MRYAGVFDAAHSTLSPAKADDLPFYPPGDIRLRVQAADQFGAYLDVCDSAVWDTERARTEITLTVCCCASPLQGSPRRHLAFPSRCDPNHNTTHACSLARSCAGLTQDAVTGVTATIACSESPPKLPEVRLTADGTAQPGTVSVSLKWGGSTLIGSPQYVTISNRLHARDRDALLFAGRRSILRHADNARRARRRLSEAPSALARIDPFSACLPCMQPETARCLRTAKHTTRMQRARGARPTESASARLSGSRTRSASHVCNSSAYMASLPSLALSRACSVPP